MQNLFNQIGLPQLIPRFFLYSKTMINYTQQSNFTQTIKTLCLKNGNRNKNPLQLPAINC